MATITVEQLDTTPPQVGVTVTVDTDPTVVDVEVSWDDGRSWHGVRGMVQRSVVTADFFRDLTPPLNIPATYRLLADGEIVPAEVITVTSPTAWLHDPLDPHAAVPVVCDASRSGLAVMSGTAATYQRPQPVDLVTPLGARAPVASIGRRQAPAGVPLHLRSYLPDQADWLDALRALADQAGQIVITGLPVTLGLDAVLPVVAPDLSEAPTVPGYPGAMSDVLATVTQVRPTSLRLVVPWQTYQDVMDMVAEAIGPGATYQDVMDAAGPVTYIDMMRDPGEVLGL